MLILRWEIVSTLFFISFYLLISTTTTTAAVTEGATSRCPNVTTEGCPFQAESCKEDEDCSPDSICCLSGCGKVCTKLLRTGCENVRVAARRRAKALGITSVRTPRCNQEGGFEKIQCDNEIDSSCWCADETGFEIPGTRASSVAEVNCTDPKPCGAHTCRMFCPHGFALTKEGCPLCRCRDPCDDVRCPDKLDCHLEELACADPPCPPVPTCKRGRSLDSICPVGEPLRISDTIRPFLCGNDPGKPTCPPLYQCLVQQGNDYGVCCPASLKIQKTGTCPEKQEQNSGNCGQLCSHDLECPSVQKCCESEECGSSCVHPKNVTECLHQRSLSELLAVSERAGRGYVPQCTTTGQFEPRQCSRNGLVCWCVDRMGKKIKGSMGAAETVSNCTEAYYQDVSSARSLSKNGKRECETLDCAAVCEYGFKLDEDGCPTCKCDDPCEGYSCPEDEECVNVKEATCTDFLCPTIPVCRPKAVYTNPCKNGIPLMDDIRGTPITCALEDQDGILCPSTHDCTPLAGADQAVCCLKEPDSIEDLSSAPSEDQRPQTMCEYLHEFMESMEGTREGMMLALPSPQCDSEGSYVSTQCYNGECWCVDHFGTEIPRTRGNGNSSEDCGVLREKLDCLDLTCRLGCEYGFILSEETRCPQCQCRDPCSGVQCNENEQCQLVEVNCKDHYCPPVPACLPKKLGQCPYLIPAASNSCDFECNSDLVCNGTRKCCSNGCGTQCLEPLMFTTCQHQRFLAHHQAHESGQPASRFFIPQCRQDGNFEQKQCNYGLKECWCVDERGFELSRTRTPLGQPLDCGKTDKCPLQKCERDCVHGFELDGDGCRTCKCVDPCSKISCRGEGETCRLVNVECSNGTCPPVPMCLPKKENPCQHGEPLKLGNSDELVSCGPDYESCPSSHKCQLSPVGEYAVCCPKPRDVCFEPLDKGGCDDVDDERNLTRYRFNARTNKCESFVYSGCQGNHNNFHTEEMCRVVCPVLSQCERLREKNQKAAELYKRPTFTPRCDPNTGVWQPIQCLEHVEVCWCVTPQGQPLKGTLIRGTEPVCNFRQARTWARDRSDTFDDDSEIVLEELMMQIGSFDEVPSITKTNHAMITRCQALRAQCDQQGKFLPTQCSENLCWCVDEAGNQLPLTNSFQKGEQQCAFTPVETVETVLGVRGEYDDVTTVPIVNQIYKIIKDLQGTLGAKGITTEITPDVVYIKFSLIGRNKVDVAYRLEQMVMQQQLPGMTADITRSRFSHRVGSPEPLIAEKIIAMENREIVSQSPVSIVAPYHTALIVIAAASAFVISVLTVIVILYKRKMYAMNNQEKVVAAGDNPRFLSYNRPIYIELPNEKNSLTPSEVK